MEWLIGFHGGGSGIENLRSYSLTTPPTCTNQAVLQVNASGEPGLYELRGFMYDAGGNLYVANANKSNSQVLRFMPASGSTSGYAYAYDPTFDLTTNLVHPFGLAVGFAGNLYVSNQSTGGQGGNVITYYDALNTSQLGQYLGTLPQTFQQLRGIAYDGTYLYAADTTAGTVTQIDAGRATIATIPVAAADHLLYDGTQYLYVGSESNGVYRYDTQAGGAPVPFLSDPSPAIGAVAGFAFGGDGYFYVADRTGNALNRYPLDFSVFPPSCQSEGEPFLTGLGDSPEFIELWPS